LPELSSQLDPRQELYRLAEVIDEKEFWEHYSEEGKASLLCAQRGQRIPAGKVQARRAARRLKVIAGRVVHQLDRALPIGAPDLLLELAKRVLSQQKNDTNKFTLFTSRIVGGY